MTGRRDLTLQFDEITESVWTRHLERVPRSNLFQDWDFGEAMARTEGQTPFRAVIRAGTLELGIVQGFHERIFGILTFTRILRGPLFFQSTPPEIHAIAIKKVKRVFPVSKLHWSTVMPEIAPSPTWDEAASSRSLHRIMDGYESAWLNLTKPEEALRAGLNQKWRNQLVQAEKAGLTVEEGGDPAWLLAAYEDQRRNRRYKGPSAALLGVLPRSKMLTLHCLGADGVAMAGVLFIRHGLDATYQVGWTGEEGRTANAHNLLLWEGVKRLKVEGVRGLDLGGIDAEKMPGIAHFKQGLGGEAFHCAGVYL
ncbi:GNAT family N-acetyltransferase [Hwanghaeella grinnelliae]|uniref:GNAT family N-acetyltransferase n=1 Tax=Hwanghaeella grinnelliae TaxID=2500179 RepID=A0A3S2VSK3_9PROT|nr:GNAT family N-acetyltransferase [Hwanghaeella grinnelliae]RVU39518.1 GNAT family N-acetyltransferase [Hwanghaeella grinnelliae]